MISDDQQGDRDRCPDCGAAPDEDHRTPHPGVPGGGGLDPLEVKRAPGEPLIPYNVPLTADEAARMDAEDARKAREPMPIFSIITRDGSWYRSFIEQADETGIFVADPRDRDETSAYHDTGGIVGIPWSEIQSITRDGESA